MKKIFSSLLSFVFLFMLGTSCSFAAINKQINANIKTKKVPAGTIIKLKVLNPISSSKNSVGDQFDLMVTENILVNNSVVIPKGSVVRGSLEEVQAGKFLYKGGTIRLYFDHIVSATGKQVSFPAGISNNPNTTYDGALSTKTNYMTALTKTAETTKSIVTTPTTWAWEKGEDLGNGSAKYVFAPITAIVSAPVAGIYFIGDAIADVFKKGENISINQGDILQVELVKPVDMPVY